MPRATRRPTVAERGVNSRRWGGFCGAGADTVWRIIDASCRRSVTVADVATCGYTGNVETGIRELKDNLSRYIRRVEAGQRIAVTAHGRVVALLVPPGTTARKTPGRRWDELIAAGILHPPVETGDPFEDWPDIRLPPGTAAELIDADRGEA
jgi:prevent-host-death family protein